MSPCAPVPPDPAPCPVVVTVNVDVESNDAELAGAAGLFGRYSYGRYGAREGLWRLLNVFKDVGVRATFFISADDAARHGALLEAILGDGHEVAAQGSVVKESQPVGPADLELLARSNEVLTSAVGIPPRGWRSSNGLLTCDSLTELSRLGFRYDSTFEDDDMPYVLNGGEGRKLAELPVFQYLTDAPFYAARHSHERVRKVWFEEFDAMYGAGTYIHLTLHSRGDTGSSRAVRAQVVADFLAYISARPGVRFYRCDELARLCADQATEVEPLPSWNPL